MAMVRLFSGSLYCSPDIFYIFIPNQEHVLDTEVDRGGASDRM